MAGSNNNRLYELFRACFAAGKPVRGCTLVKFPVTSWQGQMTIAGIKQASPPTKVVLRVYVPAWEGTGPDWSLPDLYQVGNAFAKRYYDTVLKNNPDNLLADYHQIINEPTALLGPGAASWWSAVLDVFDSHNLKVAVGSFATGNPKLPDESGSHWDAMYPVLRRIQHVDPDGRHHVLALHAYVDPDPFGSWSDPWETIRDEMLTAELPVEFRHIPIALIEFGTRFATRYSVADYMVGLKVAEAAFADDTNVEFINLWLCGGAGAWQDSEIGNDKIDEIQNYLIRG